MSNRSQVLAVGMLTQPLGSPQITETLPHEVPPTLKLYLDGHVNQYWAMENNVGMVFLINVTTVDDACALLDELPLTKAGLMTFQYYPIGPLAHLEMLLPKASGSVR